MLFKKSMHFIITLIILSCTSTTHADENHTARAIAKSERCPVCGMYPANFPKWHAQIIFRDGEHASFDSAAEMFRFLHNMAKYDKKHVAVDINKIFVPEYNKGKWLDAKQAFFVAGSNAKGPMGNDLPAFASKEEAARFSQQSGGNAFNFEQITPALINEGGHQHSH